MFDGSLFGYIIVAVVGFVIGIFVYRNNVNLFAPIAEKIDAKYDRLEAKIDELKRKLDEKQGY